MSLLKGKSGFSLIEAVIVLAVIAIFASIAYPQYQVFLARARQKEGFSLLANYYASAQSTRAEFGYYPGNLVQTGYAPIGIVNYRLRADDGRDLDISYNDDACWNSGNDCDCAGACPDYKTWTETPGGLATIGKKIGHYEVGSLPCGDGSMGGILTTDTTFVIGVSAVINLNSTKADRWFMDHNKRKLMCEDGVY